jgi:hypothetical protein
MAVRRVRLIAALLIAAQLEAGAASALTIGNKDDRDHKVTIVEGTRSTDHVLKPNAQVANVCPKGCIVRLNDSEDHEYELEGDEVVSIEDGELYEDGPEAPAAPPASDGKAGDGKGPGSKK